MTAAASFFGLTTGLRAQEAVTVPEVEITGTAPGGVHQDLPVGPYEQPEWTTQRAFSNSRVYVRPPGTIEFNQFWTPEFAEDHVTHSFREEVEIGLPYRFQLDLYQNWGIERGDAFYKGSSVELRYALANWGKIPLNPTLYGEWSFNGNAPDVWELKLLLGQTFAHRWNGAANLTYEHETGGARERVFEMSSALTYALFDQTLNVGVEVLFERATEAGSRSDPAYEFLIGPSINVRPTRNTFITVSPQFGVTDDSPDAEVFVIAGFNFSLGGQRAPSEEGIRAPASLFGR
jgi:Putative MetA-pathway of phenol degradation